MSYGKNYWLGEGDYRNKAKFLSALKEPSLTPNIGETIYSLHKEPSYGGHIFLWNRHRGDYGTVSFMDGHCNLETRSSFNFGDYSNYLN